MGRQLPHSYADTASSSTVAIEIDVSAVDRRAVAFARLFEAVHEGVYIGTIGIESTSTIAANPHLKLIFGYASEEPESKVCPFDRDRFVDPQARVALLERLATDGAVTDYLLRLRRADATRSGLKSPARRSAGCRRQRPPDALIRRQRAELDDETRDIYNQLLRLRRWPLQTISASPRLNNPLATISSGRTAVSAQDPRRTRPPRSRDDPLRVERAARIVRTSSRSRANGRRPERWSTSIWSCAKRSPCAPTNST
jgi:hypothetical protein